MRYSRAATTRRPIRAGSPLHVSGPAPASPAEPPPLLPALTHTRRRRRRGPFPAGSHRCRSHDAGRRLRHRLQASPLPQPPERQGWGFLGAGREGTEGLPLLEELAKSPQGLQPKRREQAPPGGLPLERCPPSAPRHAQHFRGARGGCPGPSRLSLCQVGCEVSAVSGLRVSSGELRGRLHGVV